MNESLTPYPETGKPVSNDRIATPADAINIYATLDQADELSAQNRTIVQAMVDGAPPYDDDALLRSGASGRFNVNRGDAAAYLADALTSYTDLVFSTDTLIRPILPMTFGDNVKRAEIEDVVAEEWTEMVESDWPDFDANYQRLVCEMNNHGVGWALFLSDEGWKWEPAGWDDVRIPRQCKARESDIDVFIFKRSMLVHELYLKIKDEAHARQLGWDVDEIKKAIVCATRKQKTRDVRGWTHDWARIERELKNNDLSYSYAESQSVSVLHFWARGFDGRYSHLITTEEIGKSSKFLYKKLDKFKEATNAFIGFTNSVSQNGTWHGIRGLAYRLFPQIQVINRAWCTLLDATQISSSIFLQPRQDADLDQPPITMNGAIGLLSPDFNPAEVKWANPSEGVLRVIEEAQRTTQQNTGQYKAGAVNPTGQEKTRAEVMMQAELDSSLSVSAVNLFYRPWEKLVQEMFRRTQAIRPTDKHYPEVAAFYKRCADRGVTPDMVKAIERVKAVKSAGSGSKQQRVIMFDEAMQLMGSFDEVGRRAVIRDRIAARMGRDMANRYLPPGEEIRPVIDEKIAELENAALQQGVSIEAKQGENHAVHARIHMEAMLQEVQGWEEARLNNELDFENIQPRLAFVEAALVHVEPHIDALGQDNTRKVEFGQYRKAYQQVGAMLEGFIASYQKYLRDNRRQSEMETPDISPEAEAALKQQALLNEQELAKQRESADIALGKKAADVRLDIEKKRTLADIEAAKAVAKSPVA